MKLDLSYPFEGCTIIIQEKGWSNNRPSFLKSSAKGHPHLRGYYILELAAKLIASLRPVIDHRRRLALIVDDTLMARSCSKNTELLAKVYDHDKHEFLTGYRGLTIGWSDGNTFLPVNFALMSTKKKKNMIGSQPVTTDQRSIASRRRTQAQRPMNKS